MAKFRVNNVERSVVPYSSHGGVIMHCLIELVRVESKVPVRGHTDILTANVMCYGDTEILVGDYYDVEIKKYQGEEHETVRARG